MTEFHPNPIANPVPLANPAPYQNTDEAREFTVPNNNEKFVKTKRSKCRIPGPAKLAGIALALGGLWTGFKNVVQSYSGGGLQPDVIHGEGPDSGDSNTGFNHSNVFNGTDLVLNGTVHVSNGTAPVSDVQAPPSLDDDILRKFKNLQIKAEETGDSRPCPWDVPPEACFPGPLFEDYDHKEHP